MENTTGGVVSNWMEIVKKNSRRKRIRVNQLPAKVRKGVDDTRKQFSQKSEERRLGPAESWAHVSDPAKIAG